MPTSTTPLIDAQRLVDLITDFLVNRADDACRCATGEIATYFVGSVSGDPENWQAKAFGANRQYHLGWVLVSESTPITVRQGTIRPYLDGSDFYRRFTPNQTHRSHYSTGIFHSVFGFCGEKPIDIDSTRTWVRAHCAQNWIAIYPALGHQIEVHAIYLLPVPGACTPSTPTPTPTPSPTPTPTPDPGFGWI